MPWLEALEDRRLLTVTFTTVPGTQTNFDGAAITNVQTQASDTLIDPISYSATGLPAGLSIDPTTGAISGTINTAADSHSPFTVNLTATDTVTSDFGTASFQWDVNADPITFTNPGTLTNFDGATVNKTLTAANTQNNTLTFAATGLPTGLTMDGAGTIAGTIADTADASSPFNVVVTATDSTANASNSETFLWDVSSDPVNLTNPGQQTATDGTTIPTLALSATDSQSNALTYSATNLPPGLSISTTTGRITGRLSGTAHTGSPYSVTVTATDATANASDSQTFSWVVSPSTVTFTTIPPTETNFDGAAITDVPVVASPAVIGQAITYSATGLPSGLSISSSTGEISGLIATSADTGSPYTVTVTATDINTNVSNIATFQWDVNADPIAFTSVGAQTNDDGATINLATGATNSQNNSLAFTASGLPTGLTINSSTGKITGTIAATADATSPYTVNVTATDATADASNSETFQWTVKPSPVTVTNPGTQTSNDGATTTLQVSATDSISGDTLVYSATNLPSGLTIAPATGKISGQISTTANTGSPYAVTVTATDATANASTSQSFAWDVNSGPVTVTSPGNQTSTGLAVIKLQVSATDSTTGHKLTYTATGLPSGLTINKTTGLISGTIAESANSATPYSVTVTATDATSNASSSQTFTWTVNPGPINGVVFLDSNGNGKLDASDPRLAGVTVVLTGSATDSVNITGVTNTVDPTITTATTDNLSVGNSVTIAGVGGATGVNGTFVVASILSETTFTVTTTSAPGAYTSGGTVDTTIPISVTCATSSTGAFSFVNPPLGTYTVKVNPVAALGNSKPSIANLVSATGVTVTNENVPVASKTKVGLSGTAISLNEFLTSTHSLNQAFGPVGTGIAFVNHAPTVSKAIAAVSLSSTSTTSTIDLAGNFTDADLADSTVTLNITNGTTPEKLTLTLFDKVAPQTVANFFDYIKAGEYNNSIFSRLVQNFVLQGGGATFTPASGSTPASISSIAIGPTVPNEFKTPNTVGTIAMAQSGSNINSATDQFFFNTANNSATGTGTNLDKSSFTVFGKLTADSMAALTALTKTTTLDASGSTAATANPTVDMNNIPLTGYTAGTATTTSSTFASDATASNFMTINSITINKQPEFLTYTVSSSNPSIVAASLDPVHNEQLTLTRGTATGTATVTVTATDRFGLSVTSTITVTVS